MSDKYFFDDNEHESFSEKIPLKDDQTIAKLFTDQVNKFYSIPRERYERKEICFSPSGVTKCARELYYENTNAERDHEDLVAWKERLSRNGTGCHDVTQSDYLKMEKRLKDAGVPVKFRFLNPEKSGEKEYMVGNYKVKLRGRSDGQLAILDEDGEIERIIGWEKKTKDKRKNLNKIVKEGSPQDEHKQQAVAYALIWGITEWIFEYESLQKPEWKDEEPEKSDLAHFYVKITKDDAQNLLRRLAKIVRAIEEKKLPDPELDKCYFCPFKDQCKKDGGYNV